MPKNETSAQSNHSKKRKKNKKIRRRRNYHKKAKESSAEQSYDSSHEESESDTILEVTGERSGREKIDDWSESMLTTAEEELAREVTIYKTGTKIDELFPGGIKCREIIELCGQHQCGKTKMATSIAISLLLNYKDKQAVYMFSNNDFHVHNVRKIVLSRGLQEEAVIDVLSRMHLIPIDETEDLIAALNEISSSEEIDTYSFVFIDSITVPFYHAKAVDADSNSEMISKVHEYLFKLAKIHDKTIFLTNLALNACTHPIDSDEEDEKSTQPSQSNSTPSQHEHRLKVKHDGSESELYNGKTDVIKPALGNHWSEILDHRFIISSIEFEDSDNEELTFLDAKRKVTCLKMNEDHNDPAKAVVIKLGDIGVV